MKRIISAIVAMLMVLSMIPAFAAVEVDPTSPSKIYLNTFAEQENITGTSVGNSYPAGIGSSNIGFNKDHPANFEFKDGQLIISHPAESTKSSLTYLHFTGSQDSGITEDKFAIGFDVKFSGITSNSSNGVLGITPGMSGYAFTDAQQAKINSGEWYIGADGKAYETATDTFKTGKTAWLFYKDGSKRPSFSTQKVDDELVLGENEKPAIFCGDAKLLQDKFYTFKMSVDQTTKTFSVVILDGENIINTGIEGQIQNAFSNFYKIDMQFQATMNAEATVTFDNIFSEKLGLTVNAPAFFAPNADGTVEFNASIPANVTEPAVYINDTFVENITTVAGVTDYIVTSELPADTKLGDVKIEIRGKVDGEDISASDISAYSRLYEKEVEVTYDASKVTGTESDGTPYYGTSDTRTASLSPAELTDGLYEIGAKIKRATSSINIRLRSNTYKTSSGSYSAAGALFDGVTDPWKTWNVGTLGISASDTTNWHDLKLTIDYRENAFENAQPYSIAVDDNTPFEGTFKMDPQSTINGFIELGIYNVYFKEVYIKEIVEVGSKDIIATYNNGLAKNYEDEALNSVDMANLTFTLNTVFDNADSMKFVDAYGNEVSGVTLSLNGTNVVITPDADFTLPTGSYKLVIDKTATFGSELLGANLEVPVEIEAPATIIAPSEGEAVSNEKVTITFYAEDAESIQVYVNDENIKNFDEASANGVYTFTYAPKAIGKQVIDVYKFTAEGIELASSSFNWVPSIKLNSKSSTIDAITDTTIDVSANFGSSKSEDIGKDGSFAVKIDTKLGSGNKFANLGTAGFQRITVKEYDVKINNSNTYMYTELGVSLDGTTNTAPANYPNYLDIPGTGGSKAMFKNGVIAGSTTTYEVGKWYSIKHIIDWENFKTYVYVDGALAVEFTMTAGTAVANKATVANYSKYRFNILPISTEEGADIPSVSFDNVKAYELSSVPVASVASEIITAGTDSVDVTLDKAYDLLTASEIEIKANGAVLAGAEAAVSADGKTITVSGLANAKPGSKIEVAVSPYSLYKNAEVSHSNIATIYVANAKNVCVFPIKYKAATGTDALIYSKYINGSGDTLNPYMIVTEYDDSNRVKKTNFDTVTIEAGETGIISNMISGFDNLSKTKVMLWNTDLSQVSAVNTLAE